MGCGPSEVAANTNHARVNNHAHFRKHNESLRKDVPQRDRSALSTRRGVPLPPRISVTVPPDLALLDVVPTTPIENPTLCGYIYVPPPIPIVLCHGEETGNTFRLTVRGDRWMFDPSTDEQSDEAAYIFDMYQYASKCADSGTTVALVHRQSSQCVASASQDGLATVMDFPDWMSQDNDEIEINPRLFLRSQESPDSDYTLFQCHSGPAKYLARDAETNKAYLSPWIRYPSYLQLKVVAS